MGPEAAQSAVLMEVMSQKNQHHVLNRPRRDHHGSTAKESNKATYLLVGVQDTVSLIFGGDYFGLVFFLSEKEESFI